ncbi:MAG: DUF2169 domain-containing protein [Saccharospirillum sp.]|nr:DUF2169 domain-containing protein [Saccharospirillum sp.]
MKVIKSMHSGIIHRTTEVFDQHLFTLSSLWAFELSTGKPILEQSMWRTIAAAIAEGELFDAGFPKVQAEYLVAGSFLSPGPVPGGMVEVELGTRTKTLSVFGDRYWSRSGFTGPEAVTEVPIRYELAFGGKGSTLNPVGKGLDEVTFEGVKRTPLPNVEYHQRIMTAASDRPPPASLNRVDPVWPVRQALGGTYDQKYIEERMPGFPEDLNPVFFNDAASDQQFDGYLTGKERYRISGMNLEYPTLSGQLPGIVARLYIEVEQDGSSHFIELESKLDTVWFFPNDNMGVLIHRGNYPAQSMNASEITRVLIGHEYSTDEPRSKAHYQEQLIKRSDPEDGVKYMLNTVDLIPAGVTCGFESLLAESDMPIKGYAEDNTQAFIETQTATVTDQMKNRLDDLEHTPPADFQPPSIEEVVQQKPQASEEQKRIETLIDKVIPGYAESESGIDFTRMDLKALDELSDYISSLTREHEEKAVSAVRERIEAMREQNLDPDLADQLEQSLDQRHQPPPLPRVSRELDAQLETIRAQVEAAEKELMILQSMGIEPDAIQQQLVDMDDLQEKLSYSKVEAEKGYRLSAHLIEDARSPHPVPPPDLRSDFQRRLDQAEGLAGWDGAFADLKGVQVSGVGMNNAYLEYAEAPDSVWVDVDFTEALWVHANLTGARFTRCRFNDANLGASQIENATFVDCLFDGAGFGKASLVNSHFETCVFTGRMDAFQEARLSGVVFIDCQIQRNNFYELDMTGCRFERSVLDESNVLGCDLTRAVFEQCSLKSVNVVSSDLTESRFDHSDLNNIRFVKDCVLTKASFRKVSAELANFRECQLEQADFSQATIGRCDFSGAQMVQAVMDGAFSRGSLFINSNLEKASLVKLDAMEASFQDARITATNFQKANLYGANFYGVVVGETDFRNANLKKTLFKDWRPGRE